MNYPPYVVFVNQRSRYGFWKFIGDVFMTLATCGLWLIWIFVREMRRR
jgi:hypothetical protein